MARILLLEPDRLLAASAASFLKRAGHTVAVHTDPQSAVTGADRQPPQLVVAELQLAGRSGAEFLYEFGSYADWRGIPIIIFTSLDPRNIESYGEVLSQLDVRAVLYKPRTSLDLLQAHISRALQPAPA